MIISKERFVKIMNQIRDTQDLETKIWELTSEYTNHLYYDDTEIMFPTLVDPLIEVLEHMFDEEVTQTIQWWCYDEDFGRDFKKNDFGYTINGKQYHLDLSTPDNLYDFLHAQKNDEYEDIIKIAFKDVNE